MGAEVSGQGVDFRVWAPASKRVAVLLCADSMAWSEDKIAEIELKRGENGYFEGRVSKAGPGMLYKFQLDSGMFPDPASRFQPDGPHGPSQIIDPRAFQWTDAKWKGVSRDGQILYEMHIGTFTREGSWRSAMEQLPELARLGITILEIMPVADFAGRFGWGYDGVGLFAPTRLYGTPDDFKTFVNRAHELGLGVILDVVYNHLGPDGNYLKEFSPDYFTRRYKNEWGEAINFDGPNSGPLREFFLANAAYWIEEFHLDGFRFDATQQIFDSSKDHILAAIAREVRSVAKNRGTYLVAENETQQSRIARSPERGGYGFDALWNDDLHHSAMVALTGRNEAYYSDHLGRPQEFISAAKWGYLFQGQWYSWQNQRRGAPSLDLHPGCFVNFIQNHDQIANSIRGLRAHQLTSPGRYRAMTAYLLLSPGTPMLFQGQEFASSAPFLFFADHHPELAKLVAEGRKKFLEQFPTAQCRDCGTLFESPENESTFEHCKLDFSEREIHANHYALHFDLLKLRREDSVFSNPVPRGVDGAVLGPEAFVLRFFGKEGDDRLLLVNLGLDLQLDVAPEPLLAPVEGRAWKIKWSSEDPCYGGCGAPPIGEKGSWRIPGHAALVLSPARQERAKKDKN
ncbi:MAG TPA: malto-oligosyltrehalose trehalohydrolase [Verrucomicrobiae bacterium]|nr:malto-oligosyltrehalose trehalohydrolase [Verrucomicrobiae bacterium]